VVTGFDAALPCRPVVRTLASTEPEALADEGAVGGGGATCGVARGLGCSRSTGRMYQGTASTRPADEFDLPC